VRVDELERDLGPQARPELVEERGVGVGVPEVAALDVGEREALRRRDHTHGPAGFVQPVRDGAAELRHLVRLEPDEGRDGVVEVAPSSAEALGDRLACSLVEEVGAARDDDLRDAVRAGRPQAFARRRVEPVEHGVGELRERVVDHARDRAGRDEVLHRRPSDPVGVEDDGLVSRRLERLADAHHRRCGVAEHRDPDRPGAEVPHRAAAGPRHPDHRGGRVVEHRPRDRVQPQDVDHRVHHDDVALADEGAEGAASRRAGGDDELRHADWERVHRGRAEQRPLRAAEAEHAVDPTFEPEPQADRAHAFEHQLHRRAAAPGGPDPLEVVARLLGDLLPADVGLRAGLAEDPGVDHDGARPERRQPFADVRDLVALRVERADERDPGRVRHARSRHSRVCTATGAFWNSSSAAARCSA
jgi:hypothetical protein